MLNHKTLPPSGPLSYLHGSELEDLDLILKERRLRWYGHVERSNGTVKKPLTYRVMGVAWEVQDELEATDTEGSQRVEAISAIDPHDRDIWRSGVRSALCSKPVAWKGTHCCGYGPCTCMLIKNPMMMVMMICDPVFSIKPHRQNFHLQNLRKKTTIIIKC